MFSDSNLILSLCKNCLATAKNVLYKYNIFLVRLLDRGLDAAIDEQQWVLALGWGLETIEPYRYVTITCPYNMSPLIPHFHIVKLGCTGYTILLIFVPKCRLWVLVTITLLRHNCTVTETSCSWLMLARCLPCWKRACHLALHSSLRKLAHAINNFFSIAKIENFVGTILILLIILLKTLIVGTC